MSFFFAIEQGIRNASPRGVVFDLGHGTRSHGTLSLTDSAIYIEEFIRTSDAGYSTLPTDPAGPIPYPPRVQEAFAVDAMVNLDPSASAVGASWGAIKLANNDGKYDPYLTGAWVADGRPTKILWGQKTLEAFDGFASSRDTSGTSLGPTGTLQLAGPNVIRQDYTSALALDMTATNWVRNSNAVGAVAGVIGSGGVMPTGWTVGAAGMTVTLSIYQSALVGGSGTVLRLRYQGVPTTGSGIFSYSTAQCMSGCVFGQAVAQSVYVSRVAGSFTNVSQFVHWLPTYDTAGTVVLNIQPNFMPSITTTLARFQRTFTMPASGNAPFTTQNPSVLFYWTIGSPVDFTIDVAAPQVEFGAVATPYVPTSGVETSHGDGATNYIPRSDMSGAVVGTPGTLPTGWSLSLGGGISSQVTEVSTEGTTGYQYIGLRLYGTATGTLTTLHFGGSIDANSGQAWCQSIYAGFAAGSQAGITFATGLEEANSGGTVLRFAAEPATSLSVLAFRLSRRVAAIVTNQATTRYVVPTLRITYASGAAIDLTMRIMAPQCEGGAVPTVFIRTIGAVASRAPTYSVASDPITLNEPAATNYVLASQIPGITNETIAVSTDVPPIYTGVPVWKHLRTTTGADSNSGTLYAPNPPTGVLVRGSIWIWVPSTLAAKGYFWLSLEGSVTGSVAGNVNRALVDQWQRISATATVNAGATSVPMIVRVQQVAGDVFYTSAWQLEVDTGAPTSFIPPASTPAARDADALYTARGIFVDPPYASLVPAFNGVGGALTSDDKEITIPLRDASYWLERPVLRATYGGTGQYDGTTTLAGTLKPLVIGGTRDGSGLWHGPVHNVTPVLVDPPNLIYQVNDGAIGQIAALYEGGYGGDITYAGDVADLYTGFTPSGQYRTCLARGCLQLGSTPVRTITCDVNGAQVFANPDLVVNPDATPLSVAAYVLAALCSVPPSVVALASEGVLATVGALAPIANGCSLYLAPGDNPSGVDLLTRILAPAGMKLIAGRDGMLRAFVLAALPTSPTIKATLDYRTIISITPIALPPVIDPSPYRIRVGYNDNYTVQTSDISPLATSDRKQYLATPNSITRVNSPNFSAAITRPNDPPVITGSIVDGRTVTASATATAVATRQATLWGVRRRVYAIVVPFSVGINLDYGDAVKVTAAFGDLKTGKNGQVVGYSYRSEDGSITLRVLI